MRTYVRMIVCLHLPRLELVIAAGGPRALAGRAVAVAPLPGSEQRVGEGSGAVQARVGAGPTRFGALAAALAVRSRRSLLLDGRGAQRWLAGRPVGLLAFRAETEALLEPLQRLGVRTLGELVRLGRSALADRFGPA